MKIKLDWLTIEQEGVNPLKTNGIALREDGGIEFPAMCPHDISDDIAAMFTAWARARVKRIDGAQQ